MNTPIRDDDDLRCAEYALGVLDAQERAALEADVSRDPALQRALDDWHQRFAPLAEDIRAITPPERVWTRIRRDLGFMAPQSAPEHKRWWDSLNVWRWLTIGAIFRKWPLPSRLITDPWYLDLCYLGAKVRKQLRAIRPGASLPQ